MSRPSLAWCLALCAALGTLAAALPAWPSEPARLSLTYRGPEDAGCPDEASFRNLVAARLGYDPFVPESPDAVRVELTRDRHRMRAHVEVARQGQGAPLARDLSGDADKCEALAGALATTLAIALDPVSALAPVSAIPAEPRVAPPPPPPPPAPMLVREPPGPPPAPPPAPIPEKGRLGVYGVGGLVASILAAPTVTLGGELGAGLRLRAFSIELTGRAEATPVSIPEGTPMSYNLGATLLTAGVAPCVNLRSWSACAVLRAGAFHGDAQIKSPDLGTSGFFSAGARVGYAIALGRDVALRPALEVAIPVTETTLEINGTSQTTPTKIWNAAPIFGGAAIALLVNFF
jgi:hypothetical protein